MVVRDLVFSFSILRFGLHAKLCNWPVIRLLQLRITGVMLLMLDSNSVPLKMLCHPLVSIHYVSHVSKCLKLSLFPQRHPHLSDTLVLIPINQVSIWSIVRILVRSRQKITNKWENTTNALEAGAHTAKQRQLNKTPKDNQRSKGETNSKKTCQIEEISHAQQTMLVRLAGIGWKLLKWACHGKNGSSAGPTICCYEEFAGGSKVMFEWQNCDWIGIGNSHQILHYL